MNDTRCQTDLICDRGENNGLFDTVLISLCYSLLQFYLQKILAQSRFYGLLPITEYYCIFLAGIWSGRLIIAESRKSWVSLSLADKGMSALVNTASAFPGPSVTSCNARHIPQNSDLWPRESCTVEVEEYSLAIYHSWIHNSWYYWISPTLRQRQRHDWKHGRGTKTILPFTHFLSQSQCVSFVWWLGS